MSTLSRDYEHGKIISVDVVTLGDNLSEDAALAATTITVEDAADFDEDGGQLLLNGAVYVYTAADDDTGIITLDTPLVAAAVEGDEVAVYDPLYLTASTDKVAQVAVIGDDGNVDTLECIIAMHIADELEEGVRGNTGESVKLELDGGEWAIVDVLGLADKGNHGTTSTVLAYQDAITVEEAGAGISQAIYLTHLPITHSEHTYWNGVYQPGTEWTRYGGTVSIPDPDGVIKVGDELVCEYLYQNGLPSGDDGIFLVGTSYVSPVDGQNSYTLDLPDEIQEGDLLVAVATSWHGATMVDSRFVKRKFTDKIHPSLPNLDYVGGAVLGFGYHDGTSGGIEVTLYQDNDFSTADPAWRAAVLAVFRGVSVVNDRDDQAVMTPPTDDPDTEAGAFYPWTGTRVIGLANVVCSLTSGGVDTPTVPTGVWSEAIENHGGKVGGTIFYTDDVRTAEMDPGSSFKTTKPTSSGVYFWMLGVA